MCAEAAACMQALFVNHWLTLQRQHLIEWGPDQFDSSDIMQRRSDQVRLSQPAPHDDIVTSRQQQPSGSISEQHGRLSAMPSSSMHERVQAGDAA